jgi:hypothetical protein
MDVRGDYSSDCYALVERLLPPDLVTALLEQLWSDLGNGKVAMGFAERPSFLDKSAMELHGARHPPLAAFHWGLTPLASTLTGCELLPSYCLVRIYQQGDVLKVHSDRDECEHSMSLTLGTSDGASWPLEIGSEDAAGSPALAEDFGTEPFSSVVLRPGDAILYRGIARRHGRTTPNPNRWPAHLFLHWVDAAGPFAGLAFEQVKLEDA